MCCLRQRKHESRRPTAALAPTRNSIVSTVVSRGYYDPRLESADKRRTIDIVTHHNVHLVRCHTAAAAGFFGLAARRPVVVAPYRVVEDLRTRLTSLVRDSRFRG